ncbi:MAG TPA: RluA family pseudouridine synthase [Alphaproteobacteria bacterium]|nr:RluA family pseudouridine synthase [Alphaproteobacteria bacterium]
MQGIFSFEVTEAGQRLDVWLVGQLGEANASRAAVQRWIREHHVTRGGVAEANPARKVKLGEVYAVDVPAIEAATLLAEDIPLVILFEDEHLIVLDKPSGMAVHPSLGHKTGTLVHALLGHCGNSLSGMNGEARPGIVHRLDKDTSGILVAAKHDKAHRGLAAQFARHSIHRVYKAIVRGTPLPAAGRLETHIGRHPVDRKKRAVLPVGTSGGKNAITHYKVIEALPGASLVECRLETGRTHQIRVHMAHLGHALLGDPMYGKPAPLKGQGEAGQLAAKSFGRQALHAAELGFNHPITWEDMMFTSPLPPDMQKLLESLR